MAINIHVRFLLAWGVLASGLICPAPLMRATTLAESFQNPPASARPWVFWYWMQGAVSREGITADLTAMKQAGLGGAYLMTIKGPANPPVFTPAALQLTPEWWSLVKFAAEESDRLGLKLAMAVSDGFATAGGPWITPELSMQKLVWSETGVPGGQPFTEKLPLPAHLENYYRDVAVLAFPAPPGAGLNTRTVPPKVTTSLPGVDAQFLVTGNRTQQLRSDVPCWIQYEFAKPFTARTLTLLQWNKNYGGLYHATRLKITVSDDGEKFHPLIRLTPSRHGWQNWDADETFSLPPVTARFFRFLYDPTDAEPGAEDLDGAKWKPRLVLRGLELSSEPRLDGFEGKAAMVWRQSPTVTQHELPDALCISPDQVIDLTARLQTDGQLDWTPPPGPWIIMRFGHTSTGHHNETGGAGQGLECDKFNPVAVRTQFAGWFGEATRQLGPELASRVLKLFHVDSWETGSQNWSPVFREEFNRRRGYDPTPFLPAMAGYPLGNAGRTEKFLADLRLTVSDLTTDNFFGTLASLAHAQGCEFSAEATAPTMMGDGLRHFGSVDVPMGEFWLRSPTHDKPNDIHDAISGAHVYGKNVVQAEAFTELRMQWDEHPGMLKTLADHHLALGINRFVFHVFAHNPWLDRQPGMTLNGVGLYFQRDQTWWPEVGAWTDYISRCSALLQTGRPVAEVAYFTGETLPSRAILPERRSPSLPPGYTADSINRDALLHLATAKAGRLTLPGGASYAALVLTDSAERSRELQQKLNTLTEAGVAIIDPRKPSVHSLGKQILGAGVPPDLALTDPEGRPATGLEWIHRTAESGEIYFITNQQNEPCSVLASFRANTGQPEIWNAVTGVITSAPALINRDDRRWIPLSLEPQGSLFIVWPKTATPSLVPPVAPLVPVQPLDGTWLVSFAAEAGEPTVAVTFPVLSDWSKHADEAIRYFSGSATYTRNFSWNQAATSVWLDLGDVKNIARVVVNEIDCGVAWTPPYRVDLSRAVRVGNNQLKIIVTNTWANRLIGEQLETHKLPPKTWTTAPAIQSKEVLPAGLLGPVQILTSPP